MSECEFSSRLGAYHDRERPEDAAAVRAHVEACPACAAELARLGGLSSLLGRPAPVALSPGARERLHAAIDTAGVMGLRRMAECLTAAAAAVLVFCGVTLMTSSPRAAGEQGPSEWEMRAIARSVAEGPAPDADELLARWTLRDLAGKDGDE